MLTVHRGQDEKRLTVSKTRTSHSVAATSSNILCTMQLIKVRKKKQRETTTKELVLRCLTRLVRLNCFIF